MSTRDEDKALLSEPVNLTGDNGMRERTFRRRRSITIPFKKIAIWIGSLAAISLISYGAFNLYQTSKTKNTSENNQSATQAPSPQAINAPNGSDIPAAELTESYSGQDVHVEFTYPKTWKVSEAEAGLRIESPVFSYPTTGGQKDGNFRIYIRTGSRAVDGKYIGRGVAIKPSEKLTYKAPAVGQRSDTLLSTFGLDTPDNFAFFLIAGNFQLQKGGSLGPEYGHEAETYIIAGGYSGVDLKEDLATYPVRLDYYASTNAYKQAIEIIKTLKLK
jgi:hypothetical protein